MNLHPQCSGIPVCNWDELGDRSGVDSSRIRLHAISMATYNAGKCSHKLNNARAKAFRVFHSGILENSGFFLHSLPFIVR
jgi:hypothetical protein